MITTQMFQHTKITPRLLLAQETLAKLIIVQNARKNR